MKLDDYKMRKVFVIETYLERASSCKLFDLEAYDIYADAEARIKELPNDYSYRIVELTLFEILPF